LKRIRFVTILSAAIRKTMITFH